MLVIKPEEEKESRATEGARRATGVGRDSADGNGAGPDPEVADKATRRRFSAEYKRRIVRDADRCTKPGELGALLRRKGVYSSSLSTWRRLYREGKLEVDSGRPARASGPGHGGGGRIARAQANETERRNGDDRHRPGACVSAGHWTRGCGLRACGAGRAGSVIALPAGTRIWTAADCRPHGDDIPVPVLAPGRGKTQTGRL